MGGVEHVWSKLSNRNFFYKYLWKEQNYYFPFSCRMGQHMNAITLCRVNPEFQLACKNLYLKRIFQKQAAFLKPSLEFTIREAKCGEVSAPPLQNTGAHHKKNYFYCEMTHWMISSLQSFYALGMDNISKVALEKLVTLGQSCCFEINFLHNLYKIFPCLANE